MAIEISLLSLATALVGVLALIFFLYFLSGRSKNLPPEVGGAWPIIGHLHLLGDSKPPQITFAAMADKYGPAFIIRLGKHPALVVSSWKLAKELFSTHDTVALTRPKFLVSKYLGYDYAMFGFSPYGAYWREIRKLVALELLSVRRLELLKHIRLSETEISIKELYKLWIEKRNVSSSSKGHVLVEMKQWFGDLTLNTILRMIAGKRYFGAIDISQAEEARRCQEALREVFRLTGLFIISDSIPLLRWLDLGGYEKKMKVIGKEMDEIVEGWLKEHHRRKESAGKATGEHQDFMDVMISLLDGADNAAGYDGDTIIKATCIVDRIHAIVHGSIAPESVTSFSDVANLGPRGPWHNAMDRIYPRIFQGRTHGFRIFQNLIAGGSDTTSVTLTWALALIMSNPRVLKKVQEELDLQVGKERRVSEADITNLVYLQAIVKETLRLYPAAALGGVREFTEDSIIGGYHIPKGTRLIPNLWKLHRDPKVWPEPFEFRPERFLTTHKDIDVKGHHFELLPFSAGRRICPGVTFGLQILHLVLANLLHAFDLSNPPGEKVDMTETAGLINHKATPLQVLVAPRLSDDLY